MAVVNLNLNLEQFLEFIENLPKEYKKVALERLKKEPKIDLSNQKNLLYKDLLMKVSELNINLLNTLNSKEMIEDNFEALILLYEEIGNQYEQTIHQTKDVKEAVKVKKHIENIVSIANFYLEKINIQFEGKIIFFKIS
jgi:hypothetical protein